MLNPHKVYEIVWAGYGPDGNDQSGHIHLHPDGPDFAPRDADGRTFPTSGFFCRSPITTDGRCVAPQAEIYAAFGADPGMYDHRCKRAGCRTIVAYNDEPYCFTHSPDSGSYRTNYSARSEARREALLREADLWDVPF